MKKIIALKGCQVSFNYSQSLLPPTFGLLSRVFTRAMKTAANPFDKIGLTLYPVQELGYVNFFVIRTKSGQLFTIDSGFWSHNNAVTKHLPLLHKYFSKEGSCQALSLDPQAVQHIFISHADLCHVGGIPYFPNAITHMGQNEETSPTKPSSLFPYFCIRNVQMHGFDTLEDNQRIEIDNIFIQAIATPGHTSGSMSYLVSDIANESKQYLLFTGDTVFLNEEGQLNASFTTKKDMDQDHVALDESWRKLKTICKNLRTEGARIAIITSHTGFNFSQFVFSSFN
jgi:glyoxylase-like metal-dependent hydrolase (beta-lactamase superfamily II)